MSPTVTSVRPWYARIGDRLAYGWSNIKREAKSPASRAFALAFLCAWIALAFAAIDGAKYGLREAGWAWHASFVLAMVSLIAASVSGRREERESLLSRYRADIEAAADVCEAASKFLGDPHRGSPVVEKTRMVGARLRLLSAELGRGQK